MIQISENRQQAKITYLNYPDVCMAAIDVTKKQILVINGILNKTYSFANVREDLVLGSFGETLGGGIIRLCKALYNGERLTEQLLKTLEVKEEVRCIETFSED